MSEKLGRAGDSERLQSSECESIWASSGRCCSVTLLRRQRAGAVTLVRLSAAQQVSQGPHCVSNGFSDMLVVAHGKCAPRRLGVPDFSWSSAERVLEVEEAVVGMGQLIWCCACGVQTLVPYTLRTWRGHVCKEKRHRGQVFSQHTSGEERRALWQLLSCFRLDGETIVKL